MTVDYCWLWNIELWYWLQQTHKNYVASMRWNIYLTAYWKAEPNPKLLFVFSDFFIKPLNVIKIDLKENFKWDVYQSKISWK